MTELVWATKPGTIANMYIGTPTSVLVLAYNPATPTESLTYQLISGSLPPGMSISDNGIISGIPDYTGISNLFFSTLTYTFILRARDSQLNVVDGQFTIILNNTTNSDFAWITPSGSLGTFPNGEFYQLPLEVTTPPGSSVAFSFVSGELPPGMYVVPAGYLQGVPTLTTATQINKSQTFNFTIRATGSTGYISDRYFSLSITNIYSTIIEPSSPVANIYPDGSSVSVVDLGTYLDGSYYAQQLSVNSLNPNVSITWSNIGALPPGVTLSNTGLLSGYIQPVELVGTNGPAGYDAETVDPGSGAIIEAQEYDYGPYDFNNITQTYNFSFSVQAFDGANYSIQKYTIKIVSRKGYTADNTYIDVDNTFLTIDQSNIYYPVLLNADVKVLPQGRQDAYYAYKFEGFDFNGDPLSYSLSSTYGTFDARIPNIDNGFDYNGDTITHLTGVGYDSHDESASSTTNLPGLVLDAATGWLYGKLLPQSANLAYYEFGIIVSKVVDGVTYSSNPVYFSLPVLGEINNTLDWVTPANLGTIANGAVSDLYVEASSMLGKSLTYSLYDKKGFPIRLPQGLQLLPTGEISGRVSFEAFSIDNYTTTFDNNKLTVDRTYNFTVQAVTEDGTASILREFTILLDVIDLKPYDNLYLRALLPLNERHQWNSIINNKDIFNPSMIYRASDAWFGIAQDIEMLFLTGLNPSILNDYSFATKLNHYTKRYDFGDIKTAVVLDETYNVKYEVVYIEMLDPEMSTTGIVETSGFYTGNVRFGPNATVDLSQTISNAYIDANGNEFNVIYPNTSENMTGRLVQNVGYYDKSSLPPWMTSNQISSKSKEFSVPLGFTKAVVLAYTKPGYSNLIAYRLRNANLNFNNIEFRVDRYFLDNFYTKNFDPSTSSYRTGAETTFDQNPTLNLGAIVASVNYGVTKAFNQIHGRLVSYINANGGIDGVTTFRDGDTLIFVQQENFINGGPYDGWVKYTDAFIGDNITTSTVEGYDSEEYDMYSVVPGFLEKIQQVSPVNQRGGVWKINIINNTVNLTFVQEIDPNQKVQIRNGSTYINAIVYYNQNLLPGMSVPRYTLYTYNNLSVTAIRTTFNGDTTKFFSYRDEYYAQSTQDQIIKFPQTDAFS